MCKTLTVTLGMLAVATALGADTPETFYYANEEKIELEVVPTLISVARPLPDDDPATLLEAFGLKSDEAVANALTPGVWVIDLSRGADGESPLTKVDAATSQHSPPGSQPRTETRAEARKLREEALRHQQTVVDRALGDPATEWAYPALRNPKTGTVLFVTPQIIIATHEEVDETRLRSLLPRGVRLVRPLRIEGLYLLELTFPQHDDPLATSVRLMEDQDWIRWAEPDFIQEWQPAATPNDPLFSDQWHLLNTGQGSGVPGADARLPDAWDVETGDGGIVIAVLDDGVQLDHPDLPIFTNPDEVPGDGMDNDGNDLPDDIHGWDFFSMDNDGKGDNNPDPCGSDPCLEGIGSHGTAVAGVAAARGDNSLGSSGACQNCMILPIRIATHEVPPAKASFTEDSRIADAINYAASLADVLNNSWGGGSPSAAITTAIEMATSQGRDGRGAPVFFATGNSATGYVTRTLAGIPAGTWTFTWTFSKNASRSAGLDSAWLDNIRFQDGTREGFEGCAALPGGWSTGGDGVWTVVDDERRSSSVFGGHCALKAGGLTDDQSTFVSVTKSFATSGELKFDVWPSAERNSVDGTGPLVLDDLSAEPECFDFVELTVFDGTTTFGPFSRLCGTFSSNGNTPLQDGDISFPASVPEAIAVGASTNFDTRADYSQWEADKIDFVCQSAGGTLAITTTDLTGAVGYDTTDYTDAFSASGFTGTSSATPLCAGIAGLLLSHDPTLTASEVRSLMQASTRKIGSVPYTEGRNALYGFGAVSARLALESLIPQGTLRVEKRTIPEGDPGLFTFTGDLAGLLSDGQQLTSDVAAGTYTSTETVPTGWTLFKVACDDSDSTGDVSSATATFQVAADETATCVFTNCADSVSSTVDLSGVTVAGGQTETFEACDTLTADNFVVEDGATATLRAGRRIVLESGVQIGGSFSAVIVGEP